MTHILQFLTKLCLVICIVCIVLGLTLSLAMIWGNVGDSVLMWKLGMSIIACFTASALTLSVCTAVGGRPRRGGEKE